MLQTHKCKYMFEPTSVTKENPKYLTSEGNHVNFHIFKNKTPT